MTEVKYTKEIVCMAISRKIGGWCIAGKEISESICGDWIRPISARPHEEISDEDQRYKDGSLPKLLDIISIPMIEPRPVFHQQENHLIHDRYYWKKEAIFPFSSLEKALDNITGPLWVNGYSGTYGINDRVPEATAKQMKSSLSLIRPESFELYVETEGADYGTPRKKVRGLFEFNGQKYKLAVTDRFIEKEFLKRKEGHYNMAGQASCILCVSLGEIYDGYGYKLIASIIGP